MQTLEEQFWDASLPIWAISPPNFGGEAHLVADLEVEVAGFGVEAQVDAVPVVPDDVLGPGVLAVSPAHQLLQPGVGRGAFGVQGGFMSP